MRRYGMIIAICLLVVVNAVVLAGIAYNRSGSPAATITLTERELPLISYYSYTDRENTGLSLHLDWSTGDLFPGLISIWKHRDSEKTEWFDKAKLEAIGFECKLPLDDPGAELHYQKMLPRKTYAVLEYEGAAWEAWLADSRAYLAKTEIQIQKGPNPEEQLKKAREDFDREVRTHTRLFIIDVANDPATLRMKYGKQNRFLIFPAIARLEYFSSYMKSDKKKEPARIMGAVADILTDTIYVPKEHRDILEKLLRNSRQRRESSYDYSGYREREPSYEVKIHVGRRAEPWIVAVRDHAVETPK